MTHTILVVEDDITTSHFLKRILEGANYEILTASNGIEGIRLARERRPSLIILDLMLPGIGGMEVCDRLRANEDTEGLPIIILSSMPDEKRKWLGHQPDVDEYLTKPVDTPRLLSVVERVITGQS